jgi:tRNA threonylcarbamoyladenosine biosynthesis protein TsaE
MNQPIIYTLLQLPQIAQDLIQKFKDAKIITLTGDLGAGKTTLVKELLRQWGVQDEILSPTFTYVNCYKNDQGQKILHFDLYRITNLDQFLELGFDEYLSDPGVVCLIEWPQVIERLLNELPKKQVCGIEIVHLSDEQRQLIIK